MISLSFPPRLFLSFRLNFSTTYVRLTAPMLWYARCGRQKVSHLIRHDKNVNDIPDARYFDTSTRWYSRQDFTFSRVRQFTYGA